MDYLDSFYFDNTKQLLLVLLKSQKIQLKLGTASAYFSGEFGSPESPGSHCLAGTTGPAAEEGLALGIPEPPPGPPRLPCSAAPEIQEASDPLRLHASLNNLTIGKKDAKP